MITVGTRKDKILLLLVGSCLHTLSCSTKTIRKFLNLELTIETESFGEISEGSCVWLGLVT